MVNQKQKGQSDGSDSDWTLRHRNLPCFPHFYLFDHFQTFSMTKFVIFSWCSQPIEKFFQNYTDPINPINPNVYNIDLIPIGPQMKNPLFGECDKFLKSPCGQLTGLNGRLKTFLLSNNME